MQEQKDVLLTADIGGTNCRFSLWQANIKADVVYDEIFTKVKAIQSYYCCNYKGMLYWEHHEMCDTQGSVLDAMYVDVARPQGSKGTSLSLANLAVADISNQ